MPYTLKARQISVKDPDTGSYIGLDVLTEQTARSVINEVAVLADAKKNEVTQEATSQLSAITSLGDSKKQAITSEATSQLSAITSLGDSKKQAITSEAATRMTEITNEKNAITTLANTRKQEIIAEGNTQKAEVNRKGMEVLATIPDDYTSMSYMVDHMSNGGFIYGMASAPIDKIAEFDDGADDMVIKNLKATFEPKVDFNGYDHSWIGGGGKNILNIDNCTATAGCTIAKSGNEFTLDATNATWGSSGMATDKRIQLKAGITYTVSAYCTVITRAENYRAPKLSVRNVASNDPLKTVDFPSTDNVESRISFSYTPASDVIVYFSAIITGGTAGSASVKVRNPMIEISSSVTDYEPYENKAIISGYTGLSGKRTGKNLLASYYNGSHISNGVTFTFDDKGVITATDTNDGTASSYCTFNINRGTQSLASYRKLKPGDYYFYSGLTDGVEGYKDLFIWDFTTGARAVQWDGVTLSQAAIRNQFYQVKIIEGHEYSINIRIAEGTTVQDYKFYPMICLPDETEATWEPYQSQAISIDFETSDGTVYGGNVDIATGKMSIDRAEFIANGNTKNTIGTISVHTNTVRFWVWTDYKYHTPYRKVTRLCDCLPVSSDYNADSPGFMGSSGYINHLILRIPINSCDATISGIQNYLAAHPIKFILELEEPIERQLTPQQVTTLLGKNNIWIDGATISVTYPVDTKTYIDRKIEEKVNEMLGA